ncbi:hypothetical protein [Shewanella sp.]|uniref:hypothetical protein n=1 Tax=Shewanella sp. TaxID=50422 RepID=UPI0040470B7E
MAVENSVVIWQGKTKDIEFSYTDFKGNKSRRNVSVNKVLFDAESESFYINGICNERQAERDFKESNISTMIKVGSYRYDFQEWMLTLNVDTSEWLDKSNNIANSEPVDVPKEKISFAAKMEDHNRKQQIKLDELKSSKPNTNMFFKVLFWIGVLFVPYIFAWFTLRKGNSTKSKVIAFGWLAFFAIAYVSSPEKKQSDAVANVDDKETISIECNQTLSCLAEKHIIYAGAICQSPIQNLSKYSYEWTDGFATPRFSHYRWVSQSKGIITYIGDEIKLQNGFGAWAHYTYECDFDTAKQSVIDVRATQGRIQ